MTRLEATHIIYDIVNSGIISNELEEQLVEVANCICRNDFEKCPSHFLEICKKDSCENCDENIE